MSIRISGVVASAAVVIALMVSGDAATSAVTLSVGGRASATFRSQQAVRSSPRSGASATFYELTSTRRRAATAAQLLSRPCSESIGDARVAATARRGRPGCCPDRSCSTTNEVSKLQRGVH